MTNRRFVFTAPPPFREQALVSSRQFRLAKASLPLEGTLYDKITLSNFVDLESQSFTFQMSKTVPTSLLSTALDADLPAKVVFSARPGFVSQKGPQFAPIAKATFSVRLLDLGTSDVRQKGFLRFKYTVRSNGRRDYGFEIDRKLCFFGLPKTTLYGNVSYRTNNKTEAWKTKSSFGVQQDLNLAGIKCAARIGFTPEGEPVLDIKL